MGERRKVIILGTGGRDYHNFNEFYRNNESYEVVAFAGGADEIYGQSIYGKIYPPELSGPFYPEGIPIYSGERLSELIKELNADQVDFCMSDLVYEDLMNWTFIALTSGADFNLMSQMKTMIRSKKPVVAVCAVRTGAGKSTTTRRVADILMRNGKRVVVVRHPMAYGELKEQICQKYQTLDDMDKYNCSIEEREEYEPLLNKGIPLYSGIDNRLVLEEAEKEADIIVWDGGNNEPAFFKPDLLIVVADALRTGLIGTFTYPGQVNARTADIIVMNKVDMAKREDIEDEKTNLRNLNPTVRFIEAKSEITVDRPNLIRGKRVLVVEDGPTVTHGGAPFAAGYVAARQYKAKTIIDPRPYASGSIQKAYKDFKHMDAVLPAVGYWKDQLKDLEDSINAANCDSVIFGTPCDLSRFLSIKKPVARVNYELKELTTPDLEDILIDWMKTYSCPV